jgi:hypothetical protein
MDVQANSMPRKRTEKYRQRVLRAWNVQSMRPERLSVWGGVWGINNCFGRVGVKKREKGKGARIWSAPSLAL